MHCLCKGCVYWWLGLRMRTDSHTVWVRLLSFTALCSSNCNSLEEWKPMRHKICQLLPLTFWPQVAGWGRPTIQTAAVKHRWDHMTLQPAWNCTDRIGCGRFSMEGSFKSSLLNRWHVLRMLRMLTNPPISHHASRHRKKKVFAFVFADAALILNSASPPPPLPPPFSYLSSPVLSYAKLIAPLHNS